MVMITAAKDVKTVPKCPECGTDVTFNNPYLPTKSLCWRCYQLRQYKTFLYVVAGLLAVSLLLNVLLLFVQPLTITIP